MHTAGVSWWCESDGGGGEEEENREYERAAHAETSAKTAGG
jgi:hypothetical protein